MNRRRNRCHSLLAAALLAALSWGEAESVFAQERAPIAKGETPVFVTLATTDLTLLRQTRDAAGWADWFEEIESHDGVSLVQMQEKQLQALAQTMHRRRHRCGGFLTFDSLGAALDHLYIKRAADPEAIFVTYTIASAASVPCFGCSHRSPSLATSE